MQRGIVTFSLLLAGAAVGPSGVTVQAENWAQFRGSENTGVAAGGELPLNWIESVAWKVPLPGRGPSSPIVIDRRVYVTCSSGVTQDRLHVLCFDAADGKELWERQLWATGRTFCHPSMGVAAPTPASDGQRIFAFYSSNDLACFDLAGNLQWFRGLAHDYPKAGNDVGMASSPLVVGKTVIVQIENQGDSFAAGLDTSTGETRWRIDRGPQANWASPTLMPGANRADDVVLLQSPDGITAHDPLTGNPLPWKLMEGCAGIASPVVTGGVAYIPSNGITAVKAATASSPAEVLWKESKLSPASPSPVVYRGVVYAINRAGMLTAGNAKDGSVTWQLRLKGAFWATPVAAGDHLHLVNSDGVTFAVKLGEKGEIAATGELGEKIQSTPAAADGALFIRSDGHLYKIGKK